MNNSLAALQPYLFPYLACYQLYHRVDKFIFLNDCNFINKGWINRNRILNSGKDLLFTVPLEKASQNNQISETKISPDYEKWKSKFKLTLQHSYAKAPHFKEVIGLINQVIEGKHNTIDTLAISSIEGVFNYLDLPNKSGVSTKYKNATLKGEDRILDICLKEKATHYINPINGKTLYSQARFSENKLELSFLRSNLPRYKQFDSWIPGLSIIDVLMFNSKEEILAMLKDFALEK